MSRDVHSTHWLRPRNPPPHLGSYTRGAIDQLRQTTSPCNPLIPTHLTVETVGCRVKFLGKVHRYGAFARRKARTKKQIETDSRSLGILRTV
jgi:hypothetical protein